MPTRTLLMPIGLAVLAPLAAAALAAPATAASGHGPVHGSTTGACGGQAEHKFVEADSAAIKDSKIEVTAHKAKFHCGGEDDGHYSVAKATETLIVKRSATIRVYVHPENPSVSKTIKANKLPHWLKVNRSEPIYRIAGPKHGITKMSEQFHP